MKPVTDYDKYIAEKMTDPEWAKEFVLTAVRDGDTVDEALRSAIDCMGGERFADISGISKRVIKELVYDKHSLDHDTMVRCLAVFGLKLSAVEDKTATLPPTFLIPRQK